jgi:hypothetical protein
LICDFVGSAAHHHFQQAGWKELQVVGGSIGMDFPHIGNTSYRAHVCVGVLQQLQSVDLRHRILAAGAGEDRAALSGRPRKANAGQYAGVLPAVEVS